MDSSLSTGMAERRQNPPTPTSENVSEFEPCSVCMESLDSGRKKLLCGHEFHLDCLMDVYLKQEERSANKRICISCPLCRKKNFSRAAVEAMCTVFHCSRDHKQYTIRDYQWRNKEWRHRNLDNLLYVKNMGVYDGDMDLFDFERTRNKIGHTCLETFPELDARLIECFYASDPLHYAKEHKVQKEFIRLLKFGLGVDTKTLSEHHRTVLVERNFAAVGNDEVHCVLALAVEPEMALRLFREEQVIPGYLLMRAMSLVSPEPNGYYMEQEPMDADALALTEFSEKKMTRDALEEYDDRPVNIDSDSEGDDDSDEKEVQALFDLHLKSESIDSATETLKTEFTKMFTGVDKATTSITNLTDMLTSYVEKSFGSASSVFHFVRHQGMNMVMWLIDVVRTFGDGSIADWMSLVGRYFAMTGVSAGPMAWFLDWVISKIRGPNMESNGPQPEMVVQDLKIGGPSAGAVIAAFVGCVVFKISGKSFEKDHLKIATDLGRNFMVFTTVAVGMETMWKQIIDWLPQCVKDWISYLCPSNSLALALLGDDKIGSLIDDVRRVRDLYDSKLSCMDPEFVAKLTDVNTRLNSVQTLLVKQGTGRPTLGVWVRDAKLSVDKMISTVKTLSGINGSRFTPFFLNIVGAPGVGKSSVAAAFIRAFAPEGLSEDTLMYARNAMDPFWSGYHGQFAVIMDDLFQETAKWEDALELFPLVSNSTHLPVMPSLDDPAVGKKGTPFSSPLIVGCSNNAYPNPINVHDRRALWRRRNVLLSVDVADEYKSGEGMNRRPDKTKFPPGNTWAHLEFTLLDPSEEWKVIRGDMTFTEALDYTAEVARQHFEGEARRMEAIKIPDHLRRPFNLGPDRTQAGVFGLCAEIGALACSLVSATMRHFEPEHQDNDLDVDLQYQIATGDMEAWTPVGNLIPAMYNSVARVAKQEGMTSLIGLSNSTVTPRNVRKVYEHCITRDRETYRDGERMLMRILTENGEHLNAGAEAERFGTAAVVAQKVDHLCPCCRVGQTLKLGVMDLITMVESRNRMIATAKERSYMDILNVLEKVVNLQPDLVRVMMQKFPDFVREVAFENAKMELDIPVRGIDLGIMVEAFLLVHQRCFIFMFNARANRHERIAFSKYEAMTRLKNWYKRIDNDTDRKSVV